MRANCRPTDAGIAWWLLATTAVALLLRLLHLDAQVLWGDEIHLLRILKQFFLGGSLYQPGLETYIPLAKVYQALGRVVNLDERALRAPIVLVGVVTPALVALGARRFVSTDAALLLGMLLAVHPLFVLYSRFVRPYGIDALLLLATLYLLDRWFASNRVATLAGAVVCAAVAAWLHLVALVTAGLVFLGALLRAWAESSPDDPGARARRVRSVLLAGVACLVLVTALFAPLLGGIRDHIVLGKVAQGEFGVGGVWIAAQMLTGSPGRVPALVFFGLVGTGLFLLARRWRTHALLLLVPALGQPLAMAVIRPHLLQYPPVMARYHFYVLALWLLAASAVVVAAPRPLAAFGSQSEDAEDAEGAEGARFHPVRWTCAALVALLFWLGPYRTIYTPFNAFAHSNHFQTFHHLSLQEPTPSRPCAPDPSVHAFYGRVSKDVPFVLEWPPQDDVRYMAAQAVHCRPVKVAYWNDWGPAVDLRNVVQLPREADELAPGALVILHKDRIAPEGSESARAPSRDRQWLAKLTQLLTQRCGSPLFEDEALAAFRIPERDGGQ